MKTLICAKDVETAQSQGKKVIYIDSNTIITPSAQDMAKAYEIEFSQKIVSEARSSGIAKACDGTLDSEMIYNLLKTMMEQGLLSGIIDSLKSTKPYTEETAGNGAKVVRGDSVKFDVFDTGNPDAKVFYQELISKEESAMSAGFLNIDHSTFDWALTYEEIDYVIEGTLTVTIDGKTLTAYPGDVVYVPSESKVTWGSPNHAKVFYVTYPANWADLI